jgi:hypothetical protein
MELQIMLFCIIWVGTWNKLSVEQTRVEVSQIMSAYEKNESIRKLFKEYVDWAPDFNALLGRLSTESKQVLDTISKSIDRKIQKGNGNGEVAKNG